MSRLFVTASVLALLASPAFATDKHQPKPSATTTIKLNQESYAKASAHSASTSASVATGGNASAVGQGGSASSSANNGGVTVKTERQAPAIGGLPSGPCSGVSGGLTTPFGGIIAGTTDDQCTLRNNILIIERFDPDLAREMLNDLDGVAAAKQRLGRAQ